MFPNHIKLAYHTQALKQVRTQNCIIQEESKKGALCATSWHPLLQDQFICVYYHCWGNFNIKPKVRGLSINIYTMLMVNCCVLGFILVLSVWGCGRFRVRAHSTCILRNRSPFFTPPCSILAPRLVPVIPSLKRNRKWNNVEHTHKPVSR